MVCCRLFLGQGGRYPSDVGSIGGTKKFSSGLYDAIILRLYSKSKYSIVVQENFLNADITSVPLLRIQKGLAHVKYIVVELYYAWGTIGIGIAREMSRAAMAVMLAQRDFSSHESGK